MCLLSLKEEFPIWYEKLVLEIVHHNTVSLEKLVDAAWLEIMTKFAVGEECDFEVRIWFPFYPRANFGYLRAGDGKDVLPPCIVRKLVRISIESQRQHRRLNMRSRNTWVTHSEGKREMTDPCWEGIEMYVLCCSNPGCQTHFYQPWDCRV